VVGFVFKFARRPDYRDVLKVFLVGLKCAVCGLLDLMPDSILGYPNAHQNTFSNSHFQADNS
jgi:hypothetical protein